MDISDFINEFYIENNARIIRTGVNSFKSSKQLTSVSSRYFTFSAPYEVKYNEEISNKFKNDLFNNKNKIKGKFFKIIKNVIFLDEYQIINNPPININVISDKRKYCVIETNNHYIILYYINTNEDNFEVDSIESNILSKYNFRHVGSFDLSNNFNKLMSELLNLFFLFIKSLPEYRIKFLLEKKEIHVADHYIYGTDKPFYKNLFKIKYWRRKGL